jgi:hypothetical protein
LSRCMLLHTQLRHRAVSDPTGLLASAFMWAWVEVVGRLSVVWAGSGDGWVAGRVWSWRCCADRRAGLAAGGHAGVTPGGWVNRRRWGGSAAQRQGTQPGERPGEFDDPWPGVLPAQDDPAGVADDPGGHMQQPVAQRLGLGHGQVAVQQQYLGPGGEILGGKDQLQPDAVAPPQVEGEVGQAGSLGGADAVLDPGALAVPQLQGAQIRVGLVGEEDLEAVPVKVVKRSWAPGWGSSRRQIARVPTGQEWRPIQPVSSHTSAPWRTWPSPSIAGVQAAAGWARTASRTWASIGMPTENPTP